MEKARCSHKKTIWPLGRLSSAKRRSFNAIALQKMLQFACVSFPKTLNKSDLQVRFSKMPKSVGFPMKA